MRGSPAREAIGRITGELTAMTSREYNEIAELLERASVRVHRAGADAAAERGDKLRALLRREVDMCDAILAAGGGGAS
jgi:hypothetical protein